MLHPSYNELMDYVNENAAPQENGEPLVQSRYTLVMAAAKRARQIVDARSKVQTSFTAADKPLSVAVKELYSGEVRILGENEEPDPVVHEEEETSVETEEASSDSDVEAKEGTPADEDAFMDPESEVISADDADKGTDMDAPAGKAEADTEDANEASGAASDADADDAFDMNVEEFFSEEDSSDLLAEEAPVTADVENA